MRATIPFDNLDRLQRDNRRRAISTQIEMKALLGNADGVIYVPNFNGNRVYVRLSGSVDDNGNFIYSQVAVAKLTGANYFEYAGCPVVCRYDSEGNLIVTGLDYTSAEQAQISIPMLNPTTAQNQWVDLSKATIALSRPVSTAVTPSRRVAVAPLIYDTHGEYKTFYGTPQMMDKVDLSSYIPVAGEHCLVQLWLNTYENTIHVTSSTAQAITTAIDNTDVDECWTGRYNDWLPLQSYLLKDNQSEINDTALFRDHRQWINTPQETGIPNPLTHNWRIWDGREVSIYDTFELGDYTITIEDGAELIVYGGDLSSSPIYAKNVTTVTGNYTALTTDWVILCNGALTVTLPTAVGVTGKEYHVKNIGTGLVRVDANGTQTIDGELIMDIPDQYTNIMLVSNGANWFIL